MSASLGDLLAFSITSGSSSQFDWNFGDGSAHTTGNYAQHAYNAGGSFTVTLRPMYSDNSAFCGGTSYQISVAGPAGQFSAAYEDGTPITYSKVTAYKNIVFTALDSAGLVDAGSYAWDFGDGGTAQGSSTAVHPYAPGTFTARLTVTKNGLPVTTTLALTVPAPPEPPKWVVPGMAYVPGQVAGATWQSDVTIMNPSPLSAKYAVTFLDARAPITDYAQLSWIPFTIGPLASIGTDNVLGAIFGQQLGAYGALMIRGDQAPLPPVITARTFNNGDPAKGTFGLSVPQSSVSAGVSTQAAPAASVLVGLRQNDAAYTNIGLVNLHNDWATVEMDFYDGASSTDLGTLTVQINPYQSYQINKALQDGRFVPAAGYTPSSNLYSVLVKVREGTGVYPYATVIDLGTTDPIVVTPTAAPSNAYRIPGIVRLAGANGEQWRSRVTVANPSTASRKVHMVFSYQACNASGCSSLNSTAGDVNFAPGATQSWEDFVNIWLTNKGFITVSDGTSYQNSFLDVSPGDTNSDPVVVLGETYNATPAGHVGLQIPGYTPQDGASHSGAYKRLVLSGLAQSSTYRTNLALVALGGTSGKWATVHVVSAEGTNLQNIPVSVDGVSQLSAGTLFAGLSGDLSRVSIVVDNMDDGMTIGAYATIIDNVSGDATFVKATPVP
jgi:PKD repeat protein